MDIDILVIGAGIAGCSLTYRLADKARILVVDAEPQAGYHATGRSAAMYMASYGTPTIRALTRASRAFFESPPAGFTEQPLLAPRGLLYLVNKDQVAFKEESLAQMLASGAQVVEMTPEQIQADVPCVRVDRLHGGVYEAGAMDIDVDALLQGFVRGARQQGAQFRYAVTVSQANYYADGWHVRLSDGTTVKATIVVNAAGAWAPQIGSLFSGVDAGLQPKRRSAFTFTAQYAGEDSPLPAEVFHDWPTIMAIDETFYFKPDAGQLLGSPANADPVVAHDVVAEELDIAHGIDRIITATRLQIRRPNHTWAGLRTFASDNEFVIGWDPDAPKFFWLAGQGGYGIQTAPGASLLACDLLLNKALNERLVAENVDTMTVSPRRFVS